MILEKNSCRKVKFHILVTFQTFLSDQNEEKWIITKQTNQFGSVISGHIVVTVIVVNVAPGHGVVRRQWLRNEAFKNSFLLIFYKIKFVTAKNFLFSFLKIQNFGIFLNLFIRLPSFMGM